MFKEPLNLKKEKINEILNILFKKKIKNKYFESTTNILKYTFKMFFHSILVFFFSFLFSFSLLFSPFLLFFRFFNL
jgi:hypothetical protein